jgi:hypothetical protein
LGTTKGVMKLSDVSLDLKSLVLGAVVGGILMLSVGAATTTGSSSVDKWDYKVAAPPHGTFDDPNVGPMGQLQRQQAFLNEFGKEGWELVTRAEGNVFYFKRGIK